MRTREEILCKLDGIPENKLTWRGYISKDITLKAMQEYAEEYHRAELLKLNKSDVISSLRQCTNCVHYRDEFDCDTCNEHLDKWQSNDL